jgi:cytochrome c551
MARAALLAVALLALSVVVSACGTAKITVPSSDKTMARGAGLFAERCSGCHTLKQAGARGSASNIRTRERTDGPNFNNRTEQVRRVLYAIHNGGFSGAIMPQNIVVGSDADAVAKFVAKYAGSEAKAQPSPSQGVGNQSVRGSTPSKNQPAGGSVGTKPASP